MTAVRNAFFGLCATSALAFLLPSPVFAQGAVKEGSFATTGADVAENEACEGEGCWGRKRRIRVVQVKSFKKDGRLEVGVLGGFIPNDPFTLYSAAGVRMSYFVSESLAIGGTLVMPIAQDTGLGADVFVDYPNIDSRVNLEQRLFYHLNVLEWTPMVGKMAFYSLGTVQFDLGLSAGFGLLHTETPKVDLAGEETRDSADEDRKFLFTAGGGLRFYIGDWGAVRFDVGQYFYQKPDALGGLSHPTMISLGLSAFLGGA